MKVYILYENYMFEGSTVAGVYANKKDAIEVAEKNNEGLTATGMIPYTDYSVSEVEVVQ